MIKKKIKTKLTIYDYLWIFNHIMLGLQSMHEKKCIMDLF